MADCATLVSEATTNQSMDTALMNTRVDAIIGNDARTHSNSSL